MCRRDASFKFNICSFRKFGNITNQAYIKDATILTLRHKPWMPVLPRLASPRDHKARRPEDVELERRTLKSPGALPRGAPDARTMKNGTEKKKKKKVLREETSSGRNFPHSRVSHLPSGHPASGTVRDIPRGARKAARRQGPWGTVQAGDRKLCRSELVDLVELVGDVVKYFGGPRK